MSTVKESIPEEFLRDVEQSIEILRECGAQRIYLFGSIVDDRRSRLPRDLNIAVSGLPPERFFSAYARLMDRLEHEFDLVDLDLESAFTESLRKHFQLEQVAYRPPLALGLN